MDRELTQPSRDRQIELMTGVKERLDLHLLRWLERKDFQAALHLHEDEDDTYKRVVYR
jgi:hypothetical protein